MGCLVVLACLTILIVIWGPALLVVGWAIAIWEWIKPPFVWLWENRVLLSFLTMGVMLVPWVFIWSDDRGRKARRSRAGQQDSLEKARKSNYEIYLERKKKRDEDG